MAAVAAVTVVVVVVVTSVAVVAVTLVVAALTLVVAAGTSELEQAWLDPVSAVVVRVPFVDRPPLRDRMVG